MAIDIRPLAEQDLGEADRIFRLAFGTFLGLPDPTTFAAGADCIGTRWRARSHNAAFGAYDGDMLVGSNLAANWGSFGFFGPLTIRPDYWDRGIARRLLEPVMDQFATWQVRAAGLFTFPQSPKHLALYQKHDFWPQHLTALMAKPVGEGAGAARPFEGSPADLPAGARAVTDAIFPGLDLGGEIQALLQQSLGEVVTIGQGGALTGFALCHMDAGSEAGPGAAYIKFAAVGPDRPGDFDALVSACEVAAARRGMSVLTAGVNMACHGAYRAMLAAGFRTQATGVAMQLRNDLGYLSPRALMLGDWR